MRRFVLPDEDTWALPEAWRRELRPRRGGPAVPGHGIPGDAVDRLRASLAGPDVVQAMQRVRDRAVIYDAELLTAGEAHLDGWRAPGGPDGEPDPRAAAAAALLTRPTIYAMGERLVHAWVSRFGLVFAVRAVGEMTRLVADGTLWAIDPAPEKTYERLWRGEDMHDLARVARVLRAQLATAPDSDYDQACRILSGYRSSPVGRIVTSYLVPTQTTWVEEDCAATAAGWPGAPDRSEEFSWGDHRHLSDLLLLAVGTLDQLALLSGALPGRFHGYKDHSVVGTVLDAVGPAAVVALLGDPFYRKLLRLHEDEWINRERLHPDAVRLLAEVPSDDAIRMVFREVVTLKPRPGLALKTKVLTRFPVRALRVLAELEAEESHPVFTGILGFHLLTEPRLLPAVAGSLPAAARARAEEIVATGGAGIGAAWAEVLDNHERWDRPDLDSADELKKAISTLAAIPTEEALGRIVDRVERRHFRPALLTAAKRDPRLALRVLAAKAADETVAELLRNHVLAYPQAVAETLPDLDDEARARVEAITGPVRLPPATTITPATAGGPATSTSPASNGPATSNSSVASGPATSSGAALVAGSAVTPQVLAGPPRRVDGRPMRAPSLPEWLVLPTLPIVTLREGGGPLSPDAVRNLCGLLAASKISAAHPGIAEVSTVCERATLAAFAWAIFEQWKAAQYPSRSNMAMVALAVLGDDDVVAPLVAHFAEWTGATMRVRTGMAVIAAIGTDTALTQLDRLARKAKSKGFRKFAAEHLDEVAAARGLRPEELADRIVPGLGLDADGRAVLDYGPRRFTVGFDEQFQPSVTDAQGKRLTRLPRPAATDDAELAAAAQRRFTELRKDLRTIAGERARALEEAMAMGRRWTGADFRRLFVDHPLHWQLTRRLVWAAFDGQGRVAATFRAAEDRTFADIDDKTWTLDPAAAVGVAHPWHFGADGAGWAEVFADYAIIQPFPQVGREVFTLGDLDVDAVVGSTVESRRIYALTARGWRFGHGHGSLLRDWPGDVTIELVFGPGYHWQEPDLPQSLTAISGELTALDPVGVSEVVRDVRSLLT
ncbi:hypothetical protein GCM10010112_44840 [Actinoplanes lobatus]|uniref:DUF4132 domain-containing protein n=1 Tax=Actinoplanes lobatus TaxID=113568 RepID=A0A7W7HGB4_9ACTN|nr:DUF4132 domain-containing protein [Actinoplanes lobatus]MBB4749969.1 hypothetical protein [Actinoplanes lobatus]GGN74575.1 hypothetical protein GCM10010112_44840 [Actinoplanes lobatus]GIE39142.1 hypothetical protein Alo02nite_20400 [Actinoplanes lobatus]